MQATLHDTVDKTYLLIHKHFFRISLNEFYRNPVQDEKNIYC